MFGEEVNFKALSALTQTPPLRGGSEPMLRRPGPQPSGLSEASADVWANEGGV